MRLLDKEELLEGGEGSYFRPVSKEVGLEDMER